MSKKRRYTETLKYVTKGTRLYVMSTEDNGVVSLNYIENTIEEERQNLIQSLGLSGQKTGKIDPIVLESIDNTLKSGSEFEIYRLFTGEEFLEHVDCGGIVDYDGIMSDVFVDGFSTNLGLIHKGLCQGNFLLDVVSWRNLCKNHRVEVNWCNN